MATALVLTATPFRSPPADHAVLPDEHFYSSAVSEQSISKGWHTHPLSVGSGFARGIVSTLKVDEKCNERQKCSAVACLFLPVLSRLALAELLPGCVVVALSGYTTKMAGV
jgi:hypothetical protein